MNRLRLRLSACLGLIAALAIVMGLIASRWREDHSYDLKPSDSPFLVMVAHYRGADAADRAYELAAELRSDHGLKAYLWRSKDSRAKSAAAEEVAVLVGDARTESESQSLWRLVRKIKPRAATTGASGLRRAIMTTNPMTGSGSAAVSARAARIGVASDGRLSNLTP